MTAKEKSSGSARNQAYQPIVVPDDFPDELRGDFRRLSQINVECLGVITGYAIASGGYVGVSVTDDLDSCKLTIRCKKLAVEKRCSSITQFEALLAYCRRKLAD